MRCISIRQPWVWAMVAPPDARPYGLAAKRVENRSWPTPRDLSPGELIALHASVRLEVEGVKYLRNALRMRVPDELPTGAIIAVARFVRGVRSARSIPPEQRPWWVGSYGHVFDDPALLTEPVAARGALGYWTLEAAVEAAVRARL